MRVSLAKVKAVATSVVTVGTAVVAGLTAFAVEVVPVLPVDVGVKVGAAVASAVAAVSAVVKVVSRVTQVPDDLVGLEPVDIGLVELDRVQTEARPYFDDFWGVK